MLKKYKEKKENFNQMLKATQIVANEYKQKSYDFWASNPEDEIRFDRTIDGIELSFVIDWAEQKDGGLFVDIIARGNLPTNFGAQPREYFVVYKQNAL